jgi:hypothetical protein
MSGSVSSQDLRRWGPLAAFLWVLVPNAVLGLPAYFVSFLFAYGFRDQVGLAEHATFLVLIAIFASVSGLVGAAAAAASLPGRPFPRRAAFGVRMSLALNSAVVGAGSIVSALHKQENSVSAEFSTATDVLVAGGLFVVAAMLAVAAVRGLRRRRA